jgi:hypothetical protein
LIGNGFRLLAPDAPDRRNQFSDHARGGGRTESFLPCPDDRTVQGGVCRTGIPHKRAVKGGHPRVLVRYHGSLDLRENRSQGSRPIPFAGTTLTLCGGLAYPFRPGVHDYGHPKSKSPPLWLRREQQVPHRAFSPIRNDILLFSSRIENDIV